MRVADRSSSRNYLKYLNKAKADNARTNLQLASGNRFSKLSDDVSAGTRVMNTRMEMYKTEKHLDNVQTVADELSVAETAMLNVEEILKRTHQTLVAGMSEEKGETGRKAYANEIKAMRQELLQLANTKYGKKFTFGGTNSSMTAPFTAGADGRLEYNGIPVDTIEKDAMGYYYMDGTDRKNIPMDDDVFMDVGMGITMSGSSVDPDTAFQISFSGLDIVGFGKSANGESNNLYNILLDVENNLREYDKEKLGVLSDHLTEQTDVFGGNLTDIGAKTNLLETMETRLGSQVDSYKEKIKTLMGISEEQIATDIAMNDFTLKAIMQIGSRILPVSLMDFLK